MTTTSDEFGLMNNFANEPVMYIAEEPSAEEKRGYLAWGAIAAVLVLASITTAIAIS